MRGGLASLPGQAASTSGSGEAHAGPKASSTRIAHRQRSVGVWRHADKSKECSCRGLNATSGVTPMPCRLAPLPSSTRSLRPQLGAEALLGALPRRARLWAGGRGGRRAAAPPLAAFIDSGAGSAGKGSTDDDRSASAKAKARDNPGWKRRWTIVALCFVAFMLCNMDRVNMSIAILPMAEQFGWSSTTIGLVQSSFFWCAGGGGMAGARRAGGGAAGGARGCAQQTLEQQQHLPGS